jgi:aspartate-semialdehyde dehydrogenase
LAKATTIALVGSETLLGREVRDLTALLGPEFDVRLIAASEEHVGDLTSLSEEPALIAGLDAGSLEGVRATILAGTEASSRKALDLIALEPGPAVIDLTYVAEEHPDARLRAPSVESEPEEDSGGPYIIAHPAAIALALLLRRLQMHDPIRRSVVQVFAPASEHGVQGVQELQQQTVSLLSFKNLPKQVFDAQLSFSMLARYGEEAPVSLEQSELKIERHLAELLELPGEGEGAPMPSLRVVQAPVFHGYSFSVWVEFDGETDLEAIESVLPCGAIDVRGREFEPPNNVGQAGQGGISVGAIAEDRNQSGAFWVWMVVDNLRLAAENALAVAKELA